MEAFNLAEQYQCPVIVLSDLQLSLGKQTVEKLDYNRIEINVVKSFNLILNVKKMIKVISSVMR